MTDQDIGRKLLRLQRMLVVATVVLYALVIAGVVLVYRDEARTHSALCSFYQDLNGRAENGRQFLKEHPNGIPGITRAEIQRGIQGQESTLDSLHALGCK